MWFAFGLLTLVLTGLAAYALRRRTFWSGKPTPAGTRGVPLELDWMTHKGQRIGVRMGLPLPKAFQFRLRDESAFDRACKRVGIAAERWVGDAAFDAQLFIESDDDRVVRALGTNPDLRRRLLDVRGAFEASGYRRIQLIAAGGRVWFEAHKRKADFDPALLNATGDALDALTRALAPMARSTLGADPFTRRAAVILAVNAALIALAVFGGIRAGQEPTELLSEWGLARLVAPVGLTLGVAWCWGALRWLQNSSRAHRVLAELVVLGIPAAWGSCFALAREFNIAFDTTPNWERIEFVRAEATYRSCGKGGRSTCTRYVLHVGSGLPPWGWPDRLIIERAQYERIANAGVVEIDLRRGALRAPFVVDVRPAAPPREDDVP